MPDGVNDLLLNSTIGSILDSNEDTGEVQTYKRDRKVNDALMSPDSKNIIISDIPRSKKKIDLYSVEEVEKHEKPKPLKQFKVEKDNKPNKIEIDISKYLNRTDLHDPTKKDKLMPDNKENDKTNEEPIKEETKEEVKAEVKEDSKENKNTEKGDDAMYGQNYGGNIDFLMGGASGGFGPPQGPGGNDPYGGSGYGGNMYQQPPQNNFMGPGMDFGMSGPGGFQPPAGMGNDVGGFMAPETSNTGGSRETLFGVPMYDETREQEMKGPNKPQDQFASQSIGMNQGYGAPQDPYANESFYGAPMYDAPQADPFSSGGGENDIFGQLLLPENNMRIQGGKIIDDFSGIKTPPGAGNMIIGDVSNGAMPGPMYDMPNTNASFGMPGGSGFGMSGGNSGFGMPPQQGGFGMPQQGGFGMPQQGGFGMPQQGGFGMPQQGGFGMPQQGGYGMPQQGGYGMQNPYGGQMHNPYQFNELKVENNLLKKAPQDDDNYVNYSDLNKGKVNQNDMSKYVSQKESKPVPRVDLNLETGAGDDDSKVYDE